jgi:hypothetical protein
MVKSARTLWVPRARIDAMVFRPHRSRSVVALAVTAILVAACSGGDDESATESSPPASPTTPTSDPETTTTERETTTTEEATTTTEAPPILYPLTGLEAPDVLSALRPVVVAKVGNYASHPPSGLNQADIVYEEIINDSITRFAAAFQSTPPNDIVGPIRSGRLQDVDLLGSFNAPILAWSGGNRTVTAEIDASDLINLSPNHCAGSCFRTNFDNAPYNLFFDIPHAWGVGSMQSPGIPPQQFQYRDDGDPVGGVPANGVALKMDSYNVGWTWNASTGLYERTQQGRSHNLRNGERITTNNVVVLVMTYLPGISGSPDAQSVGTGEAWVLTGGNLMHGTCTRSDRLQPFTLTADDGTPILLTPGRSFVELPRAAFGTVTIV